MACVLRGTRLLAFYQRHCVWELEARVESDGKSGTCQKTVDDERMHAERARGCLKAGWMVGRTVERDKFGLGTIRVFLY
jgi:hypothetical protein